MECLDSFLGSDVDYGRFSFRPVFITVVSAVEVGERFAAGDFNLSFRWGGGGGFVATAYLLAGAVVGVAGSLHNHKIGGHIHLFHAEVNVDPFAVYFDIAGFIGRAVGVGF